MFTRTILIATALGSALSLGACAGTQNRGLETVHQPVVARNDYVFDLAADASGIAPGEAQRLAGWMQSIRVGYGDKVAIDDPNTYRGGTVREEVQAQASRYGLLLSDDAPVTTPPLAPGTVRVIVTRMTATVPGCPDFTRSSGTEFDSNMSSNHGCATNANFASMVANSADLLRGQPGSAITDPAQATKAIDAYRRAGPGSGGSAGGSTSASSSPAKAGGN